MKDTMQFGFRNAGAAPLPTRAIRVGFLCAFGLTGTALAQYPSSVNYSPTPPPTASWPLFDDRTDALSASGEDLGDDGTARGQLWADLVGRGPGGELTGPDGRLDWYQLNSNSAAIQLGKGGPAIPGVGQISATCPLYLQGADGLFEDVSFETVVDPLPQGQLPMPGGSPWGVCAGDYNGDGLVDVFVANGGFNVASPNSLLRANGNGTFSNRAFQAGITEFQGSRSALFMDADRDGDLDLHVTNGHPGESTLWLSSQDTSATDRFYRNNGDGTFTESAALAGVGFSGTSFTSTSADFDQDGLADLVVACFKQHNKIFYSNGDGTFEFMLPDGSAQGLTIDMLVPDPAFPGTVDFPSMPAELAGQLPVFPVRAMPMEATDFNGDGWTDLLIMAWSYQIEDDGQPGAEGSAFGPYERTYLYLNKGDQDGDGRGDGLFRDVTEAVGLDMVGGTMGCCVGDLNGDGFPDVYAGAGGPQPNSQLEEDYTFINEPGNWPADFQADPDQPLTQVFYEVGALTGSYANLEMAHGVNLRLGERLDVAVGNGGPAAFSQGQANRYWFNPGNADGSTPKAVRIDLVDDSAPKPVGAGARIALLRDGGGGPGQWIVRHRHPNRGFSSQRNGPEAFFAGDDDRLFARVTWADGWNQGLLIWPIATQGEAFTVERSDVSARLTRTHLPNGKQLLRAELATAKEAKVGSVWFARVSGVLPGQPARGPFNVTSLDPLALPLVLSPGAPWSLQGEFDDVEPGMYVVRYVGLGGETLAEDALWVDAQSPAALAQSPHQAAPSAPSRARSTRLVRQSFEVQASGARLSPLTWPLEPTELDLSGSGRLELAGGAVAQWNAGHLVVDLGARPATWQFGADRGQLYLDLPLSCCEGGIHGETGEWLAADSRGLWLEVDLANEPVRLDGATYGSDGWALGVDATVPPTDQPMNPVPSRH